MSDIKDLMLDVYQGRKSIEDLTDEESDMVLYGFTQLAEYLTDSKNTVELGNMIKQIINDEITDPFEEAIVAAEARGSTYWEIENNSLH